MFKRDNIAYVIPDWLANHPKVKIIRTNDYGPATKLLGVLEAINLPKDAIMVIVDDDTHYQKNFVLELAYKSLQHPDVAYGLQGANPIYDANGLIDENSEIGIRKIVASDMQVSLLQGYMGVVYRRNFFDEQIFDIIHAPQECINSDDFYLSFFLARKNISRRVFANERINAHSIGWDTERALDQHALHQLNPKPAVKHRVCLAYLQSEYPNVAF